MFDPELNLEIALRSAFAIGTKKESLDLHEDSRIHSDNLTQSKFTSAQNLSNEAIDHIENVIAAPTPIDITNFAQAKHKVKSATTIKDLADAITDLALQYKK